MKPTTFEKELEQLINRHSKENASNTPDFILAEYVSGCLGAFNAAVDSRESWYGRKPIPGRIHGINVPVTADKVGFCPICGGIEFWEPLPGTIGKRCVKCCDASESEKEARREEAIKQSYDDLAASGGIVDAP